MHDQGTRFDGLSPEKFMIAMSSSGSKKMLADDDCKLAVETLQDSNLSSKSVVDNKVALFSLSKFQYISYSLHSCTDRQNIQSHCFNSLVPGPSRNYCFKTPQNEISIRECKSLGPFCSSSGKRKIVLIAAHSWYNTP